MKWVEALKIWNQKKGGPWCVPRKGSEEHAEVMKIVRGEKMKASESSAHAASGGGGSSRAAMEEQITSKAKKSIRKEQVKSFLRRALEKQRAKKPKSVAPQVTEVESRKALGYWLWHEEDTYPIKKFTMSNYFMSGVIEITNPVIVQQMSAIENKEIKHSSLFNEITLVLKGNRLVAIVKDKTSGEKSEDKFRKILNDYGRDRLMEGKI